MLQCRICYLKAALNEMIFSAIVIKIRNDACKEMKKIRLIKSRSRFIFVAFSFSTKVHWMQWKADLNHCVKGSFSTSMLCWSNLLGWPLVSPLAITKAKLATTKANQEATCGRYSFRFMNIYIRFTFHITY